MSVGTEAWAELVKASFGMWGTRLQTGEMLVASNSVIAARMSIMGSAARRPADGDYAEITGMVAEKAIAFAEVNQALVDQWAVMVSDASAQTHHLGSLMVSGRPLSAQYLMSLTERWLAHGTSMMTRTMETGGLALSPVHQQATANARRLGEARLP